MREMDLLKRHAIVVGLPWPRGGTGQVMARQLKFLKDLGFDTTFAAVTSHYEGGFDDEAWRRFEQLAPELGADRVVVSRFSDLSTGERTWEAAKALSKGQDAMHWALAPAHFTQPAEELLQTIERHDVKLLLANHVYTLPFALRLKAILARGGKNVPLIGVTHDVQTHIVMDRNAKAPWRRRIESEQRLLRTEMEWLSKCDALIHVSTEDAALFKRELSTHKHVLMFPSFERLDPRSDMEKKTVLHVAGGHPGNVDSLAWYFREVAPLMHDPPPHAIVGQICSHADEFLPLGRPAWLTLHGEAADLSPFYRSALAAICPTTRGRGISVKTIEAFAAGLPVIGTPLAFRGMPERRLADAGINPVLSAHGFAKAVQHCSDMDFQTQQRRASTSVFDALFSNTAAFDAFKKGLASVGL
jgi:polysaccharide biosynthesis protein PslH